MAKAKKRATKVSTVREEREVKAVRLDLSPADHRRLERCAGQLGLSMSSYARMAVLERMKADEGKGGATR